MGSPPESTAAATRSGADLTVRSNPYSVRTPVEREAWWVARIARLEADIARLTAHTGPQAPIDNTQTRGSR